MMIRFRAWRNCKIFLRADQYFGPGEYLLGDSAYSPCLFIVQSFKKVTGDNLSVHQDFFNTMLGKVRVKSEHCIGILKNRFPCLKRMNIKVDGRRGVEQIMRIFTVCCVIHNVLLDCHDPVPQEWYDDIEKEIDWANDFDDNVEVTHHDVDRRQAVFNAIIEDFYV